MNQLQKLKSLYKGQQGLTEQDFLENFTNWLRNQTNWDYRNTIGELQIKFLRQEINPENLFNH